MATVDPYSVPARSDTTPNSVPARSDTTAYPAYTLLARCLLWHVAAAPAACRCTAPAGPCGYACCSMLPRACCTPLSRARYSSPHPLHAARRCLVHAVARCCRARWTQLHRASRSLRPRMLPNAAPRVLHAAVARSLLVARPLHAAAPRKPCLADAPAACRTIAVSGATCGWRPWRSAGLPPWCCSRSPPGSTRDDILRGLVRGRRHVFMPSRATDPPCGHVRDALAAHRHLGCPRPGLVRV